MQKYQKQYKFCYENELNIFFHKLNTLIITKSINDRNYDNQQTFINCLIFKCPNLIKIQISTTKIDIGLMNKLKYLIISKYLHFKN